MATTSFYNNYSPVGDILVFATCMVYFILMWVAFISRTKNYRLFRDILILMCAASLFNMSFYSMLLDVGDADVMWIYIFRGAYNISLIGALYLYIRYIHEVLDMDRSSTIMYTIMGRIGFIGYVIYVVLETFSPMGFHIGEDGVPVQGANVFLFVYLFFVILIITMIYFNNGHVYRQIIIGVGGSMVVAFLVMFIQGLFGQTSFTTATYLFPAFAVLYLIHSNPYDFESGSVNVKSFENSVSYNYERKKRQYFVSIYIEEFERSADSFPSEIKSLIREFVKRYVRRSVLFQISPGHLLLVFGIADNPNYKEACRTLYEIFKEKHEIYQNDYKLVATASYSDISADNEYLSLFRYIRNRMDDNSLYEVNKEDIKAFREHQYILSELMDIDEKWDMDDARVLVYCQPVYNVLTGKFDTAEALMRMRLEKTGMVFPDRFIPMAEKYNCIQALTMVIFSKTCREVRALLDEGYEVSRVSINFSALDVRNVDFCDNINRIVSENGIPHEKIAIEITESQSEKDFLVMKDKIAQLQGTGIKFYLDDFGTGYSNFERILELPFDIVKFDRSLTIASGADKRNETMVSYLAHLFSDMGYAVLYEGIEDENDEERCIRMCAKYLQGYKYSKPIPIEELRQFFCKK